MGLKSVIKPFLVALFAALIVAPATHAETVESDFLLKDSNTHELARLVTAVARGDGEARELLKKKMPQLMVANNVVIGSEFSEGDTKAFIDSAVAANEDEFERPLTRKEKLQSLGFVALSSGITSTAFIYFASGEITPAIMSAGVAAVLNYYFRPEYKRWFKFQQWGRDKLQEWAGKLGLKNWTEKRQSWFDPAAKTLTGFMGTVGVASIFVGLNFWDKFANIIVNDTAVFAGRLGAAAGMSLLMSQPFDTLFDNWMEEAKRARYDGGTSRFTESQVTNYMRAKSLITASLTPFFYMGEPLAYAAGIGAGLVGWTTVIYEAVIKPKSRCAKLLQSSGEQ